VIDNSPPAPGTIVRANTSPIRQQDLAKQISRESAQKAVNVRWVRRDIDTMLADPSFDASLAASRKRLEQALAIGSEIALRQAQSGLAADGAIDLIKDMASTYKTLASTEPTTDPAQLGDEALRKIAGG